MAAAKRVPKNKTVLASAAVQAALQFLQSEAVRQQLVRAPEAVFEWAQDLMKQRKRGLARVKDSDGKPAGRFGQRGLERRVENLADSFALVFGERATTTHPEPWTALDEMRTAVAVAGKLPAIKRKRMHMRIDNELDRLETALSDAVLPKP